MTCPWCAADGRSGCPDHARRLDPVLLYGVLWAVAIEAVLGAAIVVVAIMVGAL